MPSQSAAALLKQLDQFLDGKVDFDVIAKEWYFNDLHYDESSGLSEEETEFFEQVREQLDFAAQNPSPEDREVGYLDATEFHEWLADMRLYFPD